jgi:hypothetical protein
MVGDVFGQLQYREYEHGAKYRFVPEAVGSSNGLRKEGWCFQKST